MPANALVTLGASKSAGMVLTPKLEYSVSSIRKVKIDHLKVFITSKFNLTGDSASLLLRLLQNMKDLENLEINVMTNRFCEILWQDISSDIKMTFWRLINYLGSILLVWQYVLLMTREVVQEKRYLKHIPS